MTQIAEKDREERDTVSLKENHEKDLEMSQGPGLQRQLKNRHIAMIRCVCCFLSLRSCPHHHCSKYWRSVDREFFTRRTFERTLIGVIGTGLFLGTASVRWLLRCNIN